MRYGIISDIHGNLEALEAVLEALNKNKIGAYLCLGDLVGYGANPNECCQLIKELKNCYIICGNHDLAAIGKYDISWFNPYAAAAILWTAEQLTTGNKEFLGALEPIKDINNFTIVHGSPVEPVSEYITSITEAMVAFDNLYKPLCFIGHTHIAEYYIRAEEAHCRHQLCYQNSLFNGGTVNLQKNRSYIINCGSVGQPRDGNPRASYGIYDTETESVIITRIDYPIEKAQAKMQAANLPAILYLRLAVGR